MFDESCLPPSFMYGKEGFEDCSPYPDPMNELTCSLWATRHKSARQTQTHLVRNRPLIWLMMRGIAAPRGFTQEQASASSIPLTACEVSFSANARMDGVTMAVSIAKGRTLRHQPTRAFPRSTGPCGPSIIYVGLSSLDHDNARLLRAGKSPRSMSNTSRPARSRRFMTSTVCSSPGYETTRII